MELRSNWPQTWSGHWIGVESAPVSLPEPRADGEVEWQLESPVEVRPFSRAFFRKTFFLGSVPVTAPMRLTADSRFVLWINGVEVGRGPARSQPRRWRYEEFDIAPFLVAGENVIAVLVSYYGTPTSWWQPAPSEAGVSGDACLVAEARVGDLEIVSDDTWRTERSDAWSSPEYAGVPSEVLDARELPRDWVEAEFDDAGWAPAAILKATHWGAFARSTPPVNPFGRLLPRPIAVLGGETVEAMVVLEAQTASLPNWGSVHPAARVLEASALSGVSIENATLPIEKRLDSGTVLNVVLDFGRVVAGFVQLDVTAPSGTVLEMGHREKLYDPDLVTEIYDYEIGARYTCAGGGETYSALEPAGLRYMYLSVYLPEPGEVTIERVAVREHLYPQVGSAYFSSEDETLNRMYAAGVRTVQLNSFDAYTDCPTREQQAWVGDAVVHQMVHLASNEDWQLARHYVDLSNSPRPDGILPMNVVGVMELTQAYTIPDWSLHWVHGVHNLYRYTGDKVEIAPFLPTVERVLRWFEGYVDEHGTLTDVPEWNLVDWSSVFTTGRTSIVSALWARGLREFAELSDWVGNTGSADWAKARYAAVASSFDDFWDERRGLYVDHILNGEKRPAASQAANAAAIVSGLAPEPRWQQIVAAITDPRTVVVRSWVGAHGGYSFKNMAALKAGIQRVDWDAETEVVRAQPFFSYVVHDAVAQAGLAHRLIDLVRDWQELLVDGGDTFGECWGWGTPVHGWSSTPTRDLITYVLGITPASPGFERARIAPHPGGLRKLAGAAPSPLGLVEVSIDEEITTIDSPVPIVFVGVEGERELPAGRHVVQTPRHGA